MKLKADTYRLQQLIDAPFVIPHSGELRRLGDVLFIGGSLPVFATLETMYESFCQEATGLFVVTFAGRSEFPETLELVRQIKNNFSVRILGRVPFTLSASESEQAYLAGLDLLEQVTEGQDGNTCMHLRHNFTAFPRWSVLVTLSAPDVRDEQWRRQIDNILAEGAIPLVVPVQGASVPDASGAYAELLAAWQRHRVQIRPLLPLVMLVTPLVADELSSRLGLLVDKLKDRSSLVKSDLLRQLRTADAAASFDSAGL